MSKSLVRGFNWSQIRSIRESKRWSQDGLASILGVDRKQISRWENGINPRPDARAILFRMLPELKLSYQAYLVDVVGTSLPKSVPTSC